MNQVTVVRNLNADLTLVSDSQDAEVIKQDLGAVADGYDSFFVGIADGDYTEIWGMVGIVPYNSKLVTRLK